MSLSQCLKVLIIGSLHSRFEGKQDVIIKGAMLLPSFTISGPDSERENAVNGFLELYVDEIPSNHTFEAEKVLWKQLWQQKWEDRFKALKEQHHEATHREMSVNPTTCKLQKLQQGAVPNTIASTLKVINQPMFPNIAYLLSVLSVLPLTTCEAA